MRFLGLRHTADPFVFLRDFLGGPGARWGRFGAEGSKCLFQFGSRWGSFRAVLEAVWRVFRAVKVEP
eukprot:1011331-Pyramimonas_sp.AAC.1